MTFKKLAKQIKESRSIIVCTNESGDVWCGTSVDGEIEAMYLGGGLTPRISAESLEICLDIPNKDRGGIEKYEFAEDWEFSVYLMDELEVDREVTEKIRSFEFGGKRFIGFIVDGRFYFVPAPLFAPLGDLLHYICGEIDHYGVFAGKITEIKATWGKDGSILVAITGNKDRIFSKVRRVDDG